MAERDESIVVLTQHFPPETGAGPTRWDELTKRWAKDTEVTVITSAPDYPEGELYDGYENAWLHRDTRGDIEVLYTKTITSSSGNLPRRSLKFIWFMLLSFLVGLRYTSPTAVVATSPQPLTGVSAWLLARVKGGTFVYEVRDLWPETILAVSEFDNRVIIWLLDQTVAFLYRRSDILVVVSRAFINPITDRSVDQSKIVYHPNGIDPLFYEVGCEPPASVSNLSDGFTVSYVGTIGRTHGLEIIVEAARKLPDVQFVLVGEGAERKRLQRAASNLDNVVFVGRRPKAEVPYFLAAADIALVHLKPRDVFKTVIPSKLLEAMAAGLPVVLGVRGEAERILSEADAGLSIEPDNTEELVAAVEKLRDDPTLRDQLSKHGYEYVIEEFNWDTIAAEYLSNIRKADIQTSKRNTQ